VNTVVGERKIPMQLILPDTSNNTLHGATLLTSWSQIPQFSKLKFPLSLKTGTAKILIPFPSAFAMS
jgi:hypothetical protein